MPRTYAAGSAIEGTRREVEVADVVRLEVASVRHQLEVWTPVVANISDWICGDGDLDVARVGGHIRISHARPIELRRLAQPRDPAVAGQVRASRSKAPVVAVGIWRRGHRRPVIELDRDGAAGRERRVERHDDRLIVGGRVDGARR